jgi:hypothetical protein
MHLTCPIRQDKRGDGYGTEASKWEANSTYSTGHTETEPIYLFEYKLDIRVSATGHIFAVCSYYRAVENLYFGTGFGRS